MDITDSSPPIKKKRKLNNNIKWSCSEKSKHMCVYIYMCIHTHIYIIESYLFCVAVPQSVDGTNVHHVGHMKTMAAGYIWKQMITDMIYIYTHIHACQCKLCAMGRDYCREEQHSITPAYRLQTGCETDFYFYFLHFFFMAISYTSKLCNF